MTGRRKWKTRTWFLRSWLLVFSFIVVPQSEAGNLTDVLERGYNFDINSSTTFFGGITRSDVGGAIAGPMASAIAGAVTGEFPVVSVSPAFTYRFNSALNIFEPATGVPGPLFSERALTLGQGQFNFSIAYAYVNFSDLNGADINRLTSSIAFQSQTFFKRAEPIMDERGEILRDAAGNEMLLAPVQALFLRTQLDIQAHIMTPTLRYGITDNWDVGLAIPVLNTSLRVRNKWVGLLETVNSGFRYTRGPDDTILGLEPSDDAGETGIDRLRFVKSPDPFTERASSRTGARAKTSGSATGVGDIALSTTYRFWDSETGGAAFGLNLRLPTGEERDFHGTGDTHVTSSLIVSHVFGNLFEPHVNMGVDFNADDVDRSSFLYAAGGTLLVGEQLGVTVDFTGRHEFEGLSVKIPENALVGGWSFGNIDDCSVDQPCKIDTDVLTTQKSSAWSGKFKRHDIANFTVGLRYMLGTFGSAFFGVVLPLNNDSLRPDLIPSGGLELTF